MSRLFIFAALVFTGAINPLYAEPGVIVSLSSVGDRVRSQNPDLAAARLRIREAYGRLMQSGRLQNPELGFEISQDPRFRGRAAEISISQRFPLTNKLRLEKSVSLAEMKVAEAEVKEVERQLIFQARENMVKVLAVRQRRELLSSQIAVSQGFADSLAKSVEKGETSPLDAGQAKLEAIGISTQLRQLDAEEAALAGSIKPLLGMRPGERLNISGALPKMVLPSKSVNPSLRPDFRAAVLETEVAGQQVALEQAKRRDDVQAGVFISGERSEDAPNGYEREGMFGLRFSIPLPIWNKNEGAIEEARAREERTKKQVNALGRGIRLEADAAVAEMREWAELVKETETNLLPLADEQTTAAEEAYRKGQGELANVFRSRERRLQLQASRLDALKEFHLARVRYEAAVAKP